jgi:hypothetical protein
MKRTELEEYLGKHVKITLFDDDIIVGTLRKTEEYRELLKPNCYYLEGDYKNIVNQLTFRSSHVKRLEVVSAENAHTKLSEA